MVDLYKLFVDSQGPQVGPRDPFDVKMDCFADTSKHTGFELTPLSVPYDILDSIYSGNPGKVAKLGDVLDATKEASESSTAQGAFRALSKALGQTMSLKRAAGIVRAGGKVAGYAATFITLANGYKEYKECTE